MFLLYMDGTADGNSSGMLNNCTCDIYRFIIFHFVGLSELGTEVIKAFIMPKVRAIGERIEGYLDGPALTNVDRISASHVKQLIVVSIS